MGAKRMKAEQAPEKLTPEECDTLAEAVKKIGDAVTNLNLNTGLNREGIIVLMQDHTKLPKKTIKKVLDGLIELHSRYSA
jgi:hypothetical protein